MCSIHTYTHTYTHKHTHWHTLTLSVVCRWPSFNALEKWFDCASSAAQFAVEFLYKLGLPLMASSTSPSHLLTPARERERESALCVLQIYDLKCDFEKRIWRNIFCLCLCQRLGLRLLVSSFRLPSFRLTFHFCRSQTIFFLFFIFSCVALLLTNIFVFFFFFFLLCSLLISFLFVRSSGLLVCGICWWCRVVCQACEKMLR